MSVELYRSAQLSTVSPLSLEHMAFTRVTSGLERCAATTAAPTEDPKARLDRQIRLAAAIYANIRLWLTLLEDLTRPQNLLPEELKRGLLRLGATAVRHSRKILAGGAGLELLIDINRAILAGLEQARRGAPGALRHAGAEA